MWYVLKQNGLAEFKVPNGANPEKGKTTWQLRCDISDSADHRRKLAGSYWLIRVSL